MANKKISELPQASTVNDTDVIPIVQNGTTKKATKAMISPTITYGTTDLTPGVSPLAEGEFYFVYE